GDRLLEEYVLAGGEEVARHRIVRALGRGGNVHRLEVGFRDQVLVVLRRHAGARLACDLGEPLRPYFRDVEGPDERMRGEGLGADAAAPAGSYHCHSDRFHGLTLMLASLMSLPYLSISARMKAANCSGVLLTASTPRSANFFFTSGSASALTVSALSFATIDRGVPAGISTPHQFTVTRPGAAAWHGASSGSSANGSAPAMHSARSWPVRMSCSACSVSEEMKGS